MYEEHWFVADLVGKGPRANRADPDVGKVGGGHVTTAAGVTHGCVFRAIDKVGRVWGDGMTPKVLGTWCEWRRPVPESGSWRLTICDAPPRGCAI